MNLFNQSESMLEIMDKNSIQDVRGIVWEIQVGPVVG